MQINDPNKIGRNDPCPCGNGKKYKKCHGSIANKIKSNKPEVKSIPESEARINDKGFYKNHLMSPGFEDICADQPRGRVLSFGNIPPGFFIIEKFITDDTCNKIISLTHEKTSHQATTLNTNEDNAEIQLNKNTRNTDVFDLGEYSFEFKTLLESTFKNIIKHIYNKEIAWYEEPNFLRYQPGGFYALHADSENWDAEKKQWIRSIERDLSFLIYLNEDYSGGEIVFPHFNFTFKPKKGMFVCFPSDHRYIHKVNETTAGIRYVIVTWAAIKNTIMVDNSYLDATQIIKL